MTPIFDLLAATPPVEGDGGVAGENILENMMLVVGDNKWLAWLPPLPFYFMELLVGLIQALVFMLLTAVFLKLICDHGDHHDEEHKDHAH